MQRLFVDLTTAFQETGRHPHGTTRVERGLVAALSRLGAPEIGFFTFDRSRRAFALVGQEDACRIAGAPTQGEIGREFQAAGRRHPWVDPVRRLRHWLRAWRPRPALPVATRTEPQDPFPGGATLLFPGEHDRQDFALLARLKQAKDIRLAFVFYDLLHVLPVDDPRLQDPSSTDLPPTDFMVRQAGLILPISQHSARELRRHIAHRGLAAPAIQPIRLAGQLPEPRGGPTPVSGLVPGRFVLSVGDVVARKNHGLLVRVWEDLAKECDPLALVIAGRIDPEGDGLVRRVKRSRVLRHRIKFLANTGDGALAWLYRHCRFTLFPSLLEGFGLPVAESLAAGKPCIASSAASIPEAGQGFAISLDPADAPAWQSAVRTLMEDDAALAAEQARIGAGFRPVSWHDTAGDVLDALARNLHRGSEADRDRMPAGD